MTDTDKTEENVTSTIVYPNPTHDFIYILTRNLNNISNIKLRSMRGNIILETNSVTTNGINIKSIPSGNYILSIKLKDGKVENHKVAIIK